MLKPVLWWKIYGFATCYEALKPHQVFSVFNLQIANDGVAVAFSKLLSKLGANKMPNVKLNMSHWHK